MRAAALSMSDPRPGDAGTASLGGEVQTVNSLLLQAIVGSPLSGWFHS
jgi:hypothetical protein